MVTTKNILTFLLFVLLCMPSQTTTAQNNETEVTQTDNTEVKEKKSSKKKNKDVIQINEKFFFSLAINIATVLLIIFLIYYPNNKKIEYIFTFLMFNIIIFFLTYVLNEVKISMGAAFGLFAVFSMLRYRTEGISMKDMTYLFIFIAIGLISAIQLEYIELGVINGIVLIATFLLDGKLFFKLESYKSVKYENIDLIKPENKQALIDDLKIRTGLNIHRVEINKIDFLKDTASISVYFYE